MLRRFDASVAPRSIERHACHGVSGSQFGQGARQLKPDRKRRMGSENDAKRAARNGRVEVIEGERLRLALEQFLDRLNVGVEGGCAEISGETRGAIGESLGGQALDEVFETAEIDLAAIHAQR